MKRAAALAAVFLIAPAPSAWAQTSTVQVQQLLKGAANPADFADVSMGGVVSLKHKPSGVVCVFAGEPQAANLHSSPAGVMCNSGTAYELDALEVFDAPNSTEPDIQGAIQRALGAVRDLRPVNGFPAPKPAAAPYTTRRYVGTMRGGQQVYARVAWAQVGQWLIFQRVIAGLDGALNTDAAAEKTLLVAVDQAVANRPKPKAR